MAKEYISRDEMIEKTKARIVLGAPKFNNGLDAAIEVATSIPAADVVEVVRCTDCKYSMMFQFPFSYEKALACSDPHGVMIRSVQPTHFCAYGERKEGEAETKLKEGHEDV